MTVFQAKVFLYMCYSMTATEYVCECVHMCELLSLHLVQFSNSSLDLNLTDLQLDSDSLLFFQKVWKVWGFQKVLKKDLYLITEGVQSPIIKKKNYFQNTLHKQGFCLSLYTVQGECIMNLTLIQLLKCSLAPCHFMTRTVYLLGFSGYTNFNCYCYMSSQ